MRLTDKTASENSGSKENDYFSYFVDQFDDIRVLRYRIPGFEALSVKQKKFIYYLGQAALSGRDILWDQNFKYNLTIRKTIEAIINSYKGDRSGMEFSSFMVYAKKVFFSNGIHHHYSSDKFEPIFTEDYFSQLVMNSDNNQLPLDGWESCNQLAKSLEKIIFSKTHYPKKVELKDGIDLVAASASNFYEGVSQEEVEEYYKSLSDPCNLRPVSLGLNSKLIKVNGRIKEDVYRIGGKYGEALEQVVLWLEKAAAEAETEGQRIDIELLIGFYTTGDLKTWDEYNVSWAKNHEGTIDFINGFIENYEDPLGMKATWESVVEYVDIEATKRSESITANSQWFEDNSPIDPKYRKESVAGVSARVINVAMLGGDCYPSSPLGINLPNADWIRKEVGSKSVRLANIADAYDITSRDNGFLEEFAYEAAEIERVRNFGSMSDALHTDLHECVGHASGKLAEGTDPNALKNYASALEESRADLFALYYMTDNKILELKLLPTPEAAMACYDSYIRNGLITQLVRIKPGKKVEEAHMRCRSLISHWAFEQGKVENVIEMVARNGKSYVKINDYIKLRLIFGNLLFEVQRIKSEGDFESGKKLIEDYGVNVNPVLHEEVLKRYQQLNLAPYTGFVNPELVPAFNDKGEIVDIILKYTDDYLGQMMEYGRRFSFLPLSANE